jgi:predicted dehydrogenase
LDLNIGIIGFGFMGKTHTYCYKNIPLYYDNLPFKIKLRGVCSRKMETADKAKNEFGFEYATDNMYQILEDEKINVISICTPNFLHKPALIAALQKGKHIYCEKPLAASYGEAKEIISACNGSESIAQVVLQNRFFPATMRAKQIIDEGRLGNILSFRACYLHSGSVDAKRPIGWKQEKEKGGGVLFDMGVHIIDLIYYLLGEFDSLFCKTQILYKKRPDQQGEMKSITADDASYLIFQMKNGAFGTVEASKIATGTNDELKFEIHGDKGALKFNLMEPSFLEFYDNTKPDSPLGGCKGFTRIECVGRYNERSFPGPKYAVGWIRGHVHCLYSFLSCVAEGKKTAPSLYDAAYLQYVMEMGYKSAKSNTYIKL